MLNSQKHVFWQALILCVFVFGIGIFIGFLIESSRIGKINEIYSQAELELLDIKIQSDILFLPLEINCSKASKQIADFADKVYNDAKILERYEKASRISEGIKYEHKKYDLLRAILWMNSIKLRQKCNASYHHIIYLYDYNEPSLDNIAKQEVFSRILEEVKQDLGEEALLIPLSGDNNISSISLLMDLYDLSESELPIVLIDEKTKIISLEDKNSIEGAIYKSSKK